MTTNEFHKVLCLDQFYLPYICFLRAILSGNKTEEILLGPEHLRDQLSGDVVSLDGIGLIMTCPLTPT